MPGVVLVWSGLVAAFAALLALVRPLPLPGLRERRHALGVGLAGAALSALGASLPAPRRKAEPRRTLLDLAIPEWEFAERHTILVAATPAVVAEAIRAVTAREITGFRLLTWLRSPRLPGSGTAESILAPPADEPILTVALRSGFFPLGEEPGREVVLGALVIRPTGFGLPRRGELEQLEPAGGWTAERYAALDAPGYAKAAMSFLIEDGERAGWTRVTTETRIVATSASARRRFAAYWRTIYPGSSLIRHMWLDAIRRRAESVATTGPGPRPTTDSPRPPSVQVADRRRKAVRPT
jgi:hypothetical protein